MNYTLAEAAILFRYFLLGQLALLWTGVVGCSIASAVAIPLGIYHGEYAFSVVSAICGPCLGYLVLVGAELLKDMLDGIHKDKKRLLGHKRLNELDDDNEKSYSTQF